LALDRWFVGKKGVRHRHGRKRRDGKPEHEPNISAPCSATSVCCFHRTVPRSFAPDQSVESVEGCPLGDQRIIMVSSMTAFARCHGTSAFTQITAHPNRPGRHLDPMPAAPGTVVVLAGCAAPLRLAEMQC
jgi:hypothetical protein